MKLANPLTFAYSHPNFGTAKTLIDLNQEENVPSFLALEVEAPDGRKGVAQVQCQDNGNVVLRVHVSSANPIHVLVVDDSGTLFEG